MQLNILQVTHGNSGDVDRWAMQMENCSSRCNALMLVDLIYF